MRLLNATQRFVNVFAAVQSRAVVVMSNAMGLLQHLLDAHLGTPSKRLGKSPDPRNSTRGIARFREIGIRWCESPIPAVATAYRSSTTPRG